MNEQAKLLRNTVLLGISKLGGLISLIVLLPFMTARLTGDQYGFIDLVVTYGSLMTPVLLLALEQGVWRFLVDARDDEEAKAAIISTAIFTALPFIALLSALYLLVVHFIDYSFAGELFFYVMTVSLASFTSYMLRGLGKTGLFAISSIAQTILSMLGIILALAVFQAGVGGVLIAYGVSATIICVFNMVASKGHRYVRWGRKQRALRKELMRYSLPQIPSSIAWWTTSASDRTIITLVLGLAANSLYAVANKFAAMLGVIQGIFGAAWAESAAENINRSPKERNKFFTMIFDQQFRLFGSGSIILMSASGLFFRFLVDPSFAEARIYIPLLVLGALLGVISSFYSGVYFAKKLSRESARMWVAVAIVNLIVNLGLIWLVGLWAAAISTIAAFAVVIFVKNRDTRKYVRVSYSRRLFVSLGAAGLLAAGLFYINSWYCDLVAVAAAIIYAMLLNRQFLRSGWIWLVGFLKRLRQS